MRLNLPLSFYQLILNTFRHWKVATSNIFSQYFLLLPKTFKIHFRYRLFFVLSEKHRTYWQFITVTFSKSFIVVQLIFVGSFVKLYNSRSRAAEVFSFNLVTYLFCWQAKSNISWILFHYNRIRYFFNFGILSVPSVNCIKHIRKITTTHTQQSFTTHFSPAFSRLQ